MDTETTHDRLAALESEVKRQTIFLQSSIEGMSNASIFAVDGNYRYLFWNTFHAYLANSAYQYNVQAGMNILTCITIDADRKKTQANLDIALGGFTHTTIQEYGAEPRKYFETRYTPIVDDSGGVIGVMVFARNIEDRLATRKALHASEDRFNAFMCASPALTWVKDEDGRYVYMNHAWYEHFGSRLEGRIGITDFDLHPYDLAVKLRANDLEAQIGGMPIEALEETIDENGRLHIWSSYKFPFRDAQGQCLIGGIAINVTENKRKEKIRNDMERQLVRLRGLESIGTLAAGVAHQLSAILDLIMTNAVALPDAEGNTEQLQRRADAIIAASERGTCVVKQLLDVAGGVSAHQQQDSPSLPPASEHHTPAPML